MDRGWYFRVSLIGVVTLVSWLILWPSLEHWVPVPDYVKKEFGERKIAPGLDIQGGLRMMYEVEVEEAIRDRRNTISDQITSRLGQKLGIVKEGEMASTADLEKVRQRVHVTRVGERGADAAVEGANRSIKVTFESEADVPKLDRDMIRSFGDLHEVSRSGKTVMLAISEERLEALRTEAVKQAVKTISERVDELGVKEASVTSRGTDIVVEVPGADETAFARIRSIIARTARLEFKILDDEADFVEKLSNLPEGIEKRSESASAGESRPVVVTYYLVAKGKDARKKLTDYIKTLEDSGQIPEDHQLAIGENERAAHVPGGPTPEPSFRTYYLHANAELTGDYISDAFVSYDTKEGSKPVVSMAFDSHGADIFERVTGQNVKRRMAIVLDDRVESAPVIQTRIAGGHAQITLGSQVNFNQVLDEARDLVVVLKAGALPVPISPSNEQLIGPTLGRDSVNEGAKGAIAGIVLVLTFMLVYYEVAGLVADVMVSLNLLYLFALLALAGATLTLPGVAGIALTVGMSVDANVLITERIREELRLGKSPRTAVDQGFKRAFWSIFDSHITTFISGVVLFQFGTGPIKGFAVTLMAGIVTSLFTGVFCSRTATEWLVRGLRIQRLRVG